MLVEKRQPEVPYFSICIPQYNRTSFLLQLLESIDGQEACDFEVCISDGRSPEGRHEEIIQFLEKRGIPFAYQVQDRAAPYDKNLRAAISLARGNFCLLMGNDDALAGPRVLQGLRSEMDRHPEVGVVIPDYEDFTTGRRAMRIRQTRNCGWGASVAAAHFRNFSFVSGIVLQREAAQRFATDQWDGSEMYQTFIGCRTIASGYSLLELDKSIIRKDIQIPGQQVDSYAAKPRLDPCPIVERRLPLSMLGRVVADAVRPYLPSHLQPSIQLRILLQLVLFTYPFWIIEYRRVQSWRYALGVCLGMRPEIISRGLRLDLPRRLCLSTAYSIVTAAGLVMPIGLFQKGQRHFYRLAKKLG
jgi:hypothetical protein